MIVLVFHLVAYIALIHHGVRVAVTSSSHSASWSSSSAHSNTRWLVFTLMSAGSARSLQIHSITLQLQPLQTSSSGDGDICLSSVESTTEIHMHLVQRQPLRLVNGDCPAVSSALYTRTKQG